VVAYVDNIFFANISDKSFYFLSAIKPMTAISTCNSQQQKARKEREENGWKTIK
jgi:hypothetical protein